MSASNRRAKLDRDHPNLSVRRQCAMLGVARSGVYRKPSPANDNDLALMRRIDALHTERPFLGSRRLAAHRQDAGRGRLADQPQARAAADAADGDRGARTEAEDDPARAGPQDLSLSAARHDDRPAEPGLGGRHHLHQPDFWRSDAAAYWRQRLEQGLAQNLG